MFTVIDNNTGEQADSFNIAIKEKWAKELSTYFLAGFFIGADGKLILADHNGQYVHCPEGRFTVVWEKDKTCETCIHGGGCIKYKEMKNHQECWEGNA